MSLSFRCPMGHKISVPDNWIGRTMTCPVCRQRLVVPPMPSSSLPPRHGKRPHGPLDVRSPRAPSPNHPGLKQPHDHPPALTPAPTEADDAPAVLGYRADQDRRFIVARFALALALAAALAAFPAATVVVREGFSDAPRWAQWSLIIALLQAAYIAWMLLAPDWATVWSVTWLFALVAALYATMMAATLLTPRSRVMLLDISDERDHAPFWCFAVVIVMLAVTYFSGRFANRWKHDVMRAAGRK